MAKNISRSWRSGVKIIKKTIKKSLLWNFIMKA